MIAAERAEAGKAPPAKPAEAKWDAPIPLADLPPVPPFPLDALPERLAEFVADVAGATNSPPDFAGGYAVAIAAGTTGATRAAAIKDGHVQRGSVYLAAVGVKGGGKSPALELVAAPVYDEQARLKRLGGKTKAFTSDVTAEKLARMMQDNPRGVLMVRDELAGWLLSFNQYKAGGKGSDRQFFLSAWTGAPVAVDRKGKEKDGDDGEIYVRWPCLSVVGTIQPSVLDRFRADADDGFYDRMLFCYPDELPMTGEKWLTVCPARAADWADALRNLRGVGMIDGSTEGPRPLFMRLDEGGRAGWESWTHSVAAMVNAPDFDEVLRGPYVKLAGYAARLALTSHMLRGAYGEGGMLSDLNAPVPVLDGESMRRGISLGTYFLGHAVRVWTAAGLDNRFGPARKLLRWAGAQGQPFTRRDAHRAMFRQFPTADTLDAPLALLMQHGFLRFQSPAATPNVAPQKPAPGRTTAVYEVHPELCQRVNGVSASAPEKSAAT